MANKEATDTYMVEVRNIDGTVHIMSFRQRSDLYNNGYLNLRDEPIKDFTKCLYPPKKEYHVGFGIFGWIVVLIGFVLLFMSGMIVPALCLLMLFKILK